MARALFTSAVRREVIAADAFMGARRLVASEGEDRFEVGSCMVTCRYWAEAGDFMSKQKLGCHNAIRVGRLRCDEKQTAMERVSGAKTVIGLVGPEGDVDALVRSLAQQHPRVIVTGHAAIVAG